MTCIQDETPLSLNELDNRCKELYSHLNVNYKRYVEVGTRIEKSKNGLNLEIAEFGEISNFHSNATNKLLGRIFTK